MEKDKFLGQVLNHWWKVVARHYDNKQNRAFYTLENQANGIVLERVRKETLENCISGKMQISALISMRLKKKNINSRQEWW